MLLRGMIVHHESINHIWKYQCYIMQPWGFYRSWNFNPGVYEPLKLTCKILCICSLLWEGGNQFLPKRCVSPPPKMLRISATDEILTLAYPVYAFSLPSQLLASWHLITSFTWSLWGMTDLTSFLGLYTKLFQPQS